MIRLNDINNFIEVSAFQSMSLAAKKLEVTQPALSESISRLEKDLGFKLFYRTKNGISLTPEGRKTLEKVRTISGMISELGTNKESFPALILGCHSTVGAYFLPQLLSLAAKALPQYQIQLKHDLSRNIQMDIQAGKIDFGVVVNAHPHPDLIIKPLAEDRVAVWKAKSIKPQDQIIADPNLFQTQSILKKWNKRPDNLISTESLDLIARMTEAGCGYGIIPERIVKLLKLNLTQVSDTPSFVDKFSVVYRPEFGKSKYEKTLIDLIFKVF